MNKLSGLILISLLAACSQKVIPPSGSTKTSLNENALKGQKVFMENCNRCHPGGMSGLGPAIINKPLPSFLIKFQVRNGLGVMPSFHKDHLSKEELNNVITYIKEQRSK